MSSFLFQEKHKETKTLSRKFFCSFPLITLLSSQVPLLAVFIEGEINRGDLASKYNGFKVTFGRDAIFIKDSAQGVYRPTIAVGDKTRFLNNLSISKIGLNQDEILILPETLEPILIRNFGNTKASQWTLGINAAKAKNVTFINESGAIAFSKDTGITYSGRFVVENREWAEFKLAKGFLPTQGNISSSLIFNNRGIVESSTDASNVGDGITARGEIVFNNFGSSSLAKIYLMSGDVDASNDEFDQHSSLVLHNEGTMIATVSEDFGDTTNVIEARGKAVIINYGLIKGGIAGGSGQSIADVKGQGQFEIKNYGKILDGQTHDAIVITSASNSITNYGHIDSVRMYRENSAVRIENKGSIDHLYFKKSAINSNVTLADDFAFKANRSYESQGGIEIDIEGGGTPNPKIKLAGGRKHSFIALADQGTELGREYKVENFFGSKIKNLKIEFQDDLGVKIETSELHKIILSNLKTADNLYALKVTATGFSFDVKPEQSFGHFRTLQSARNLIFFSARLQGVLARVMDNQSLTLSKSQKFWIKQNKNSSKLVKETSFIDHNYLRFAQASQGNISKVRSDTPPSFLDAKKVEGVDSYDWTSFILPYYSFLRFKPQALSPVRTQMGGVFAGATKSFENQILLGFHLGVEYQNSDLDQNVSHYLSSNMKSSGFIYSLGLHSKIPLTEFVFKKLSLIPFLRTNLSTLLVQNTYSLSPSNEKTQERRKLSGGMILDFLAGVELKTSFALFNLETGFSQQVLHLPKFSFTNFQNLDSQFYDASTLTPLHYLLQTQYRQNFEFSNLTFSPRVKLGMQTALFGNKIQNSLRLPQGNFKTTQSLDKLLGIFEAGLGFEFKKPLSFEINYLGEYGTQSEGHSVDVRVGLRF